MTSPRLTRRNFNRLLLSGALAVAAGNTGRLLVDRLTQVDPNQVRQQTWDDVSATATAGTGREIVGDASAHFPEQLISKVRQAVGMVTIRFAKPDGNFDFETGTAWVVNSPQAAEDASAVGEDDTAYLMMSAHVFTKFAKYSPESVSQIQFGRPHVDREFIQVDRENFRALMPTQYEYRDWRNDYCLVRMYPTPDTPLDNLRNSGLTINTHYTPRQGERLLEAGFPEEYTYMATDPLSQSSLNASTATVGNMGDGVFDVQCLVDGGSSGSPLVNNQGEAVAIVSAGYATDEYRTLATDMHRVGPLLTAIASNK